MNYVPWNICHINLLVKACAIHTILWHYAVLITLANVLIVKRTRRWLLNTSHHYFQSFFMVIHVHLPIILSFDNINATFFTCPLPHNIFLAFLVTRSLHKLRDTVKCYNKLGLLYYQGKGD